MIPRCKTLFYSPHRVLGNVDYNHIIYLRPKGSVKTKESSEFCVFCPKHRIPKRSSSFWIRNWSHIANFLYCCSPWGNTLFKNLKLGRFKSNRDEIWQQYALIDRIGFLIWRYKCFEGALLPWRNFTQKSAAIWCVHMQCPPGANCIRHAAASACSRPAILCTVPDP